MTGYGDLWGPDGKMRPRRLGFVQGVDPVATHDQARAEALDELRKADGFLLVTFAPPTHAPDCDMDDDCDCDLSVETRSMLAYDGPAPAAIEILLSTAEWLQATALEYLVNVGLEILRQPPEDD
jgi:hypothetical protein